MKQPIIYLILILTIISFVYADTTYTGLGGDDGDFKFSDISLFNGVFGQEQEIVYSSTNIENRKFYPLVDDLDADGVNEIIIMDDDLINIYQGTTLTFLASYDYGFEQKTSNFVINDIDSDGTKEIIFYMHSNDTMQIISYNGSDLVNDSAYEPFPSYIFAPSGDSDVILGCKSQGECAMVWTDGESTGTSHIVVGGIGSTENVTGGLLIRQNLDSPTIFCLPSIPFLDYDADLDGYVVNYIGAAQFDNAQDGVHTTTFRVDSTQGTELIADTLFDQNSNNIFQIAPGNTCESLNQLIPNAVFRQLSTPAMFYNARDRDGTEIVFGQMINSQEFNMIIMDWDLSDGDNYPENVDIDGLVMGNPFALDYPADVDASKREGICIVGYDFLDAKLQQLCVNLRKTFVPDNEILVSTIFTTEDGVLGYNISNGTTFEEMTHSGQFLQSTASGEIINSYGSFYPDFTEIGLSLGELFEPDAVLVAPLEVLWSNPKGASVIVPIDYDENGKHDLLIMNKRNLYYADDGFKNSPVAIFGDCDEDELSCWETNPCLEGVWNTNTSLFVNIIPYDADTDDLISARVTLYDGESSGTPEFAYAGLSIDISGEVSEPNDVFEIESGEGEGEHWVLDETTDSVYRYNDDWSYSGESHSIADNLPEGFYHNGSHWLIAADTGNNILVYDNDWNLERTQSIASETGTPSDIECCAAWCFVTSASQNKIYRYHPNLTYTNIEVDMPTPITNPTGLTFYWATYDGNFNPEAISCGDWWVTDGSDANVYLVDNNFTTTKINVSVHAQDTSPQGLFLYRDARAGYLAGDTNDKIYRFEPTDTSLEIQTAWSSPSASGSPIPFTFNSNLITETQNSVITFEMFDSGDGTIVSESKFFSVSDEGTLFQGDCLSESAGGVSTESPTLNQACSDSSDCGDNEACDDGVCVALPDDNKGAISTGAKDISILFGISPLLLSLLVLLIINVVIAFEIDNHSVLLSVLLIVNVISIIGLSVIGFIPTSALIVLMVVAIIGGGLIFISPFRSSGGQ